jgi:hypothetical protein
MDYEGKLQMKYRRSKEVERIRVKGREERDRGERERSIERERERQKDRERSIEIETVREQGGVAMLSGNSALFHKLSDHSPIIMSSLCSCGSLKLQESVRVRESEGDSERKLTDLSLR